MIALYIMAWLLVPVMAVWFTDWPVAGKIIASGLVLAALDNIIG